jgi:hypothetical protein
VSNMYTPIARPNFSDYKHKTLELKPWFWWMIEYMKYNVNAEIVMHIV